MASESNEVVLFGVDPTFLRCYGDPSSPRDGYLFWGCRVKHLPADCLAGNFSDALGLKPKSVVIQKLEHIWDGTKLNAYGQMLKDYVRNEGGRLVFFDTDGQRQAPTVLCNQFMSTKREWGMPLLVKDRNYCVTSAGMDRTGATKGLSMGKIPIPRLMNTMSYAAAHVIKVPKEDRLLEQMEIGHEDFVAALRKEQAKPIFGMPPPAGGNQQYDQQYEDYKLLFDNKYSHTTPIAMADGVVYLGFADFAGPKIVPAMVGSICTGKRIVGSTPKVIVCPEACDTIAQTGTNGGVAVQDTNVNDMADLYKYGSPRECLTHAILTHSLECQRNDNFSSSEAPSSDA